jgi:DNA-binding PadR family transcriptional regulator
MDYWCNIVKSYDDPKSKDPKKRDDGKYSQFSVVVILMYLFFGSDYPYKIAKYFEKLSNPEFGKKRARTSVLHHTGKIGTVLNRMEEDGLLSSEIIRLRKYFTINPRIIQSLVKDATYFKSDGSTLEIPSNEVEQLLAWQEENIKQFNAKDLFFETVLFSDAVDYLTFMIFLKKEIEFYELINKRLSLRFNKEIHIMGPNFDPLAESLDKDKSWYKKISKENDPRVIYAGKISSQLSDLISEYIDELEGSIDIDFDLDKEHGLSFQEFKPKSPKV